MIIKWFGQSCFMITSENGTKVLTDTFKKMLGYKLSQIDADIVSKSHNFRLYCTEGIRTEDIVLVTENGCENLISLEKMFTL
jgi:L-ascorbate metabolism protein UlaG (beta-lactamase superfamily)